LCNLAVEKTNQFLEQIEIVDCLEEKNIEDLHQKIIGLSKMNKIPFSKNSGSRLQKYF